MLGDGYEVELQVRGAQAEAWGVPCDFFKPPIPSVTRYPSFFRLYHSGKLLTAADLHMHLDQFFADAEDTDQPPDYIFTHQKEDGSVNFCNVRQQVSVMHKVLDDTALKAGATKGKKQKPNQQPSKGTLTFTSELTTDDASTASSKRQESTQKILRQDLPNVPLWLIHFLEEVFKAIVFESNLTAAPEFATLIRFNTQALVNDLPKQAYHIDVEIPKNSVNSNFIFILVLCDKYNFEFLSKLQGTNVWSFKGPRRPDVLELYYENKVVEASFGDLILSSISIAHCGPGAAVGSGPDYRLHVFTYPVGNLGHQTPVENFDDGSAVSTFHVQKGASLPFKPYSSK